MSGIFFASLPVHTLFNITDQDIPFFTVKRHHEKKGRLFDKPAVFT